MGSPRANQCSAPTAICMVSSFHLSIFYPLLHPSLSAPSVLLLESGTPIPGTEPKYSQKHTTTYAHRHPHTCSYRLFHALYSQQNQRANVFCFGFFLLIFGEWGPVCVCVCVCIWVDSHPEQPLCCLENKACLKLS